MTDERNETDFKDVVAIFVSEFAAGGIAGLAQKETALLDGNKDAVDANKDTFLAIAETNGLFFALRGGLKAAAQLLGTSHHLYIITPTYTSPITHTSLFYTSGITTGVASVVTLLLAITFSEEFKILSRRSSPLQTLLPVDLKDSATSVFGANITTTEVLADVTKWITYDVSIESLPETFYSAIGCGALAGITSQLFREFGKGGFNSPTIAGIREVPIVRIARAAVEGTVQFVAYEASRQWLFPYIPDINPYIPNINPLSLTLEDMSALVLHTIPPS